MKILMSILAAAILLNACDNEDRIEGFSQHEILVVTLELLDTKDIREIRLISSGGSDKISAHQLDGTQKVKLKTPQTGEGTCTICVYTSTDTLCSQEMYVEGGYRVGLRFLDNKFETMLENN